MCAIGILYSELNRVYTEQFEVSQILLYNMEVEADTLKFCFTPILATLKSKFYCPFKQHKALRATKNVVFRGLNMHLNNFQLLESVRHVSRRKARSLSSSRTSWRAFSRSCSEMSVWCQMFTIVPIESNLYNTCPKDIKLNQSGLNMSLPIVIQFRGNPGSN